MTPRGLPKLLCPHRPSAKQQRFLDSEEVEVFFGGAAGGGKSAALLMGALQYVHVPGYAALIIRKDLPRLALAGGLIPKSHEWLTESGAEWNQARRQWSFPVKEGPPATITFGYLSRPLDKFRYASSEFQYIAFDELTDFQEDDYLFLFSRLRRVKRLQAPLRMRSASNPGGVGHLWVKQRFVERAESGLEQVKLPGRRRSAAIEVFRKEGRLFIPARIADNPALDEAEYRETLFHLPPVVRERLMNGDWDVQESAIFKAEWLRYYVDVGDQMELQGPSGETLLVVPQSRCRRFVTIDPAGTSADRMKEQGGKGLSWTVAQVWDQGRREAARFLMLRHQIRARLGFDGLHDMVVGLFREWKPDQIWVEEEKLGRALHDMLRKSLPIECVPTRCRDKSTRAGALIMKLQRGEVFFPKLENSWRPGLEAELLSWTGHDAQAADQIDAAAYAAIVAGDGGGETIRLQRTVAGS